MAFILLFMLGVSNALKGEEAGVREEKILEVNVRGNNLVPDADIIAELGIEPGTSISEPELHRRIARINEWGGFGRFSFYPDYRQDGVAITVVSDEMLRLQKVELLGNRAIRDKRLLSHIGLQEGRVLEQEEIRRARERILSLYREQELELASVGMSGRFHEDGTFTLVFDINEGKKLRVKRINFTGNTVFTETRLRWIMSTHVYLRLPFIRKGLFDEEVFYEDLSKIEARYHRAGYIDAEVGGYRSYTEDFDGYELDVVIYEGPRYRISTIELEGNLLFRDAEIIQFAGIHTGKVFNYDLPGQVQQDVAFLYATQGLVDVNAREGNLDVEALVVDTEKGLVDIRINIEETEPVYIRRIRVEGLTKTDELVVLRRLRFEPGDRVNIEDFRASERALLDTGYFDLTRPDSVAVSLEPGTGRYRDVVVKVREGLTGNVMLGAGFGDGAGFFGNITVVEKNFDITNWPRSRADFRDTSLFRGGGQELSLRCNIGTERSDASIMFREPSIRHTDYSYSVSAFSRLGYWPYFGVLRSGAGATLGRRLGKHVSQQIGVGLEHIHITGMSSSAPEEIARDDRTFWKPYVDLSLRRDTRDSTMFPTTGYTARLGAEMGMCDIRVLQLSGSVDRYWRAYENQSGRRQVFHLRGFVGVMESYGGQSRIPVFERFYGGGLGSVRGFERSGLAPVEPEKEEQVGGKSMLTGTAEYTIPLFTDHLRLAFFVDAGYVEEEARDVFNGWDKLRVSAGTGIRWFLPAMGGIPITLDFARPLLKEDYDRTQTMHFNLGLMF